MGEGGGDREGLRLRRRKGLLGDGSAARPGAAVAGGEGAARQVGRELAPGWQLRWEELRTSRPSAAAIGRPGEICLCPWGCKWPSHRAREQQSLCRSLWLWGAGGRGGLHGRAAATRLVRGAEVCRSVRAGGFPALQEQLTLLAPSASCS